MSPALVKAAIDTLAAKANNILSSNTKSLYGLGDNATPDDIFSLLSRFQSGLGNEYIWEKSKTEELEDVVELTNVEIWQNATGQNNTFYVGTGFTNNSGSSTYPYKVTGITSFSSYSQTAVNVKDNFLGKYISAYSVLSSDGSSTAAKGVYYIPSDAVITFKSENVSGTMYYSFAVDKVIATRNHRFVTTKYGYVNSADKSAYPPTVSDGYTYTFMGQLGSKVQIVTGSYTGDGNYGSSNKNGFELDFIPKIVLVVRKQYGNYLIVMSQFFYPMTRGITYYTDANGKPTISEANYCTWDKTFQFYGSSSSNQMNDNNVEYEYIAIG